VLERTIETEEEKAFRFYSGAALQAEDPGVKKLLKKLAGNKLEKLRNSEKYDELSVPDNVYPSSLVILCIADHIDKQIYSKTLRENYGHIDIVLSAGDLPLSYYDFIVSSLNKPLLFVFGNHQNEDIGFFQGGKDRSLNACPDPSDKRFCGSTFIDGKIKKVKGVLIGGLGGSIRYNEGNHQFTNTGMTMRIIKMVPKLIWNRLVHGRFLDILLTHAPPKGIHDCEDPCHRGFPIFLRFIRRFKPKYLIHGHVHLYDRNKPRRTAVGETTVLNAYDHIVVELHNID